jgi:hypothetical protein
MLVQAENTTCTSNKDNKRNDDMNNRQKSEARHTGRKISHSLTTEDKIFCSGQWFGQAPDS